MTIQEHLKAGDSVKDLIHVCDELLVERGMELVGPTSQPHKRRCGVSEKIQERRNEPRSLQRTAEHRYGNKSVKCTGLRQMSASFSAESVTVRKIVSKMGVEGRKAKSDGRNVSADERNGPIIK